jgi:glycosyltransferase involved in cell wall biosynthesis
MTTNADAPRPLVTIGLPVFNGEEFIDEAIRSIRNQTLDDFELIIADNASEDLTVDICRRHAREDPRVTVVTSDHNRGAAWNYNRLVPMARAELFKWSAHDDVIEPDFLLECVDVLVNEPDVVLCFTKAIDIDGRGHELEAVVSKPYAGQPSAVDRARELLAFDSSCVETFGVVRTGVLRKTELIGAYTSSDRTLLLELTAYGRFHEVEKPLLHRRQHDGRSVRVPARQRNAWFDPRRQAVFTFPRWRLLAEFARAVRRSPLGRLDRARVSASVARWATRNWKALGRDLAAWAKYRLSRSTSVVTNRHPSRDTNSEQAPETETAGI